MSWDNSSNSKALLKKACADPVTDIWLYVEHLSKEILSEKNHAAFAFLKPNIASVQGAPIKQSLKVIETTIERLNFLHPDQEEIVGKIENILNSYKNMLETIKQ